MPAGSTYTPIATTTLGSAASSVTFSSISGSYTDLVIVVQAKATTGFNSFGLQFNGDTGNNYSNTGLSGNGSSASSFRQTNQPELNIGIISASDGVNVIQVMNYSNTTTFKTVLGRANIAADATRGVVALWRNTAAISSILLKEGSGNNMSAGSTFTLYGIASA